MKVHELHELTRKLINEGKGETPVVWQSLHSTWDIELREVTRSGVLVLLVNP